MEIAIRIGDSNDANLDAVIASLDDVRDPQRIGYKSRLWSAFEQLNELQVKLDERLPGERFYISIFAEHNVEGTPWSIFNPGNGKTVGERAEKLRRAFWRVVDLARRTVKVNANFVQVFNCKNVSPTSFENWGTPFKLSYAGNEYVDYVGIDFFNRYGTSADHRYWRSAAESIGSAYAQITEFVPQKPIIIGGFNSVRSRDGFSRPEWLIETAGVLRARFPQVVAASFFALNTKANDWRFADEERFTIGEAVRIMRSDPLDVEPYNMVPYGRFKEEKNWAKSAGVGVAETGVTISTSSECPPGLDLVDGAAQKSIVITKTSQAQTEEDPSTVRAFLRLSPCEVSANSSYTVSFYARSTQDAYIGLSMGQGWGAGPSSEIRLVHVSRPTTVKDAAGAAVQQWRHYTFSFANPAAMSEAVEPAGYIRLPAFDLRNVGPVDGEAFRLYIAGLSVRPGI